MYCGRRGKGEEALVGQTRGRITAMSQLFVAHPSGWWWRRLLGVRVFVRLVGAPRTV